jgi:hypothetical protein
VIFQKSFLKVQNTFKVLGFTQGNTEEDIRNDSYIEEGIKNINQYVYEKINFTSFGK